jgi:biotin carboxyl carrier protein
MTRATIELDGVAHEVRCVRDAKGDGWTVTVDGQDIPVRLEKNGAGLRVAAGARSLHLDLSATGLTIDGRTRSWRVADVAALEDDEAHGGHGAKVRPPMNGKVERLAVAVGQTVAKGDLLFILEAMKMQNEVRSPAAGKVAAIHAAAGAVVEPSQVVVEIVAPGS